MRLRFLLAWIGAAAMLATPSAAQRLERNLWPVKVTEYSPAGAVQSWEAAGPLIFRQPLDGGGFAEGLRPLYLHKRNGDGTTETSFLYPILVFRTDQVSHRWSLLQLVNFMGPGAGPPAERPDRGFDVWPFYFSRETGSPATSYHALFPIAGTIKNRLFNDRATWLLFPLYLRTVNRGVIADSYLWPIGRVIHGAGHEGFAVWPLIGRRGQAGVSSSDYYLWPLIYRRVTQLDQPVPDESYGFLPFYAREHSADVIGETYLFPFFGYMHRTAPYRYDETRYFWPLFVQGRGDRYRNRWAPFYTHSIVKGLDKTWVLWPLYRQQHWTDDGRVLQRRTQFFYFLYWSLRETSLVNPRAAPAVKTHVWPFYSVWDNGAGRRQLQVLSPIEVFFPHNENMRLLWSPLFAFYRFDQRSPDDVRHSVFFDLITWRRRGAHREFHLGPLFSRVSGPATARVSVGHGLLGLERGPRGWRPFWFDFSAKSGDRSAQTAAIH